MPEILDYASLPRSRTWIAYAYALLAQIVFIALGVSFLHKHDSDWDVTYLLSAKHLWAGHSIYHNGDGYIYPPFPALFALPFAYLPGILPKLTWYAVTVFCFIVLCRFSWGLALGPRLRDAPPGEHLAFFLGLLPGATYAFNCISHCQTDILIGSAIIAGCVALTRGRPFLAATLYGFAAAMKGPALIWFAYLIWRRKPLAAVWLVIFFLSLNLAPNLVSPTKLPRLLLAEFAQDYLAPKTTKVYPDVWFSESNQSLVGSLTRWTTTRWEWKGKTYLQRIPLDHPATPTQLKLLTLGGYGILLIVLGTALGWWPSKLDTSGSMRPALEFGMVATLMLVCSPMAAKAQWGVLMLPGFCLARLCVTRREPIVIILFTAGWCCWLMSQNLIGNNGVFVGLWYGAVLWNALLWFAASAYLIVAAATPASPSTEGRANGDAGVAAAKLRKES
jgi:hypothetical protein